MPGPRGRAKEFDNRLVTMVDDDMRAWVAAMSKVTGESEGWVVRSILTAWRTGEMKIGTTSTEPTQVTP
jgi:hypothetical protein